jgi:MiaB-like tRNA modifying enzyme
LIITGCLPIINYDRIINEIKFDAVLGPSPGTDIVKIIKKVLNGERVINLKNDNTPSLSLPRSNSSEVIRIIPISYGCLGECSYCCVRFARGKLRSYGVGEIIDQVKSALNEGIKEVWFTSQDSACYGKDSGTNLITLMKKTTEINGVFRVRIGMMNPEYVLEILHDLIEVYKENTFFKFLHLPIQSGDDGILSIMRRHYKVSDVKKIVNSFKEEIPNLSLATDFICGFPGEDKCAFQRSLKLIKKIKPDVINISKFSPRPNTSAKEMEQIDNKEISYRSRIMSELSRKMSLEKNKQWMEWSGEVIVDEKGKFDNSWIGRNYAYKPVVIKHEKNLLGKRLKIQIFNVFSTYLEAKILEFL